MLEVEDRNPNENPGVSETLGFSNVEYLNFLKWGLPHLRLRWAGFRKVRRQVCKRLKRRINELGLPDLDAYRDFLENHKAEWQTLDSLCRITISRFYRDPDVFDALRFTILPELAEHALARGEKELRCWSAGCASGEEAYTLQLLWKIDVVPNIPQPFPLRIIATDPNQNLLDRARRGQYPKSSLKDLPEELQREAFHDSQGHYAIRKEFRENIEFMKQDLREQMPEGFFHLIFCRNLVFTYFEEALQLEIFQKIVNRLVGEGMLVIGKREKLPDGVRDVIPTNINGICQLLK